MKKLNFKMEVNMRLEDIPNIIKEAAEYTPEKFMKELEFEKRKERVKRLIEKKLKKERIKRLIEKKLKKEKTKKLIERKLKEKNMLKEENATERKRRIKKLIEQKLREKKRERLLEERRKIRKERVRSIIENMRRKKEANIVVNGLVGRIIKEEQTGRRFEVVNEDINYYTLKDLKTSKKYRIRKERVEIVDVKNI